MRDQRRSIFIAFNVLLLLFATSSIAAQAKEHKMVSESIVINAPPEAVFEAIRKQRDTDAPRRRLKSFDGKVAVIDEDLDGVPIYGKVHCLWQETESPYERIDFRMLSSSRFKESYGSWILKPSADGKSTTLELDTYMNSGLMIPFSGEITRMSTARDSRARLQHIKAVAEALKTSLQKSQ